MGHSFISAIMIALFVAGPTISASNEEESLGNVSSKDGRTATITKMERRDGALYFTAKGEGVLDTSVSTSVRKAELEKGKSYVLPSIKLKYGFSYVITEKLEDGWVAWKGTMVYVTFATQDTLTLYDQPGVTVTIARTFDGEIRIAGHTMKAGDTWKIASGTPGQAQISGKSAAPPKHAVTLEQRLTDVLTQGTAFDPVCERLMRLPIEYIGASIKLYSSNELSLSQRASGAGEAVASITKTYANLTNFRREFVLSRLKQWGGDPCLVDLFAEATSEHQKRMVSMLRKSDKSDQPPASFDVPKRVSNLVSDFPADKRDKLNKILRVNGLESVLGEGIRLVGAAVGSMPDADKLSYQTARDIVEAHNAIVPFGNIVVITARVNSATFASSAPKAELVVLWDELREVSRQLIKGANVKSQIRVLDEKTSHFGAKPSAEKRKDRKDAAETALARAEILFLQGSSEEAYAAFEEVLNLAVDAETKARATVGMARVLDGDSRSKEAQELYLKASGLTTNPNTKAMILIGQTGPLLQQRRLAEARTKIEEAFGLATEPQTKVVAMMTASGLDVLEGHVEQGRKRFVATGEIIESAIRGAKDNEKKAHLKLVLATIFMAQSRWNEVEITIEEAFNLTENAETKCGILQFQGGIFSSRKQTERARHSFEQALKLAPTPDHVAKCFTGLGEVDEYEGNPSEALANYDKALAQATSKETRSLALFKKGTVLMEQGSSQEAILSFEEVIRLTRSVHRKARSLANIGSALAGQGKLTEARGKLEEALSFPLRPSVKKQIENLLQKVERATVK